MTAADQRLRRAYHAAVEAGLPRRVLLSYRQDWADARKRATSNPGKLVARYHRLADELSSETRRRQRRQYAVLD